MSAQGMQQTCGLEFKGAKLSAIYSSTMTSVLYFNIIASRHLKASMQKWLFLIVAIVSEVIATSALKSSEGFTRLWPSIIVITGYASAFYFLSLTLNVIPIGIAYAIWSGVGVALVALISWLYFQQPLDFAAVLGLLLILAGVIVINVFSKSVSH